MKQILKKLKLTDYDGVYENHFFVIDLKDSDEYAKMYTLLSETSVSTQFPSFETNTTQTATKVINYFEIDDEAGISYNIFLIANFAEDKYYIKIGEK